MALDGYSREALRPPHPSRKADRRAAISSFLYFERDPHGPGVQRRAGTEERASRRLESYGASRQDYEANGAFKGLLANLIAAWKITSRQGVGLQRYL
jgi:hypothetical protein